VVDRENALEKLAAVVATVQRVAIDGVDAAGKTILANELAQVLEQR
jgi:cytidylate kinase